MRPLQLAALASLDRDLHAISRSTHPGLRDRVYVQEGTTLTASGAPRIQLPSIASRWWVVVGLSGALYALAVEVSNLLGSTISAAGYQQPAAYYAAYHEVMPVAHFFGAFGSVVELVFVVGLRAWLARVQPVSFVVVNGVALAGATAASLSLTVNAVDLSLPLYAGRIQDALLLRVLSDFTSATDSLITLPISLLIALTSWALLQNGGALRLIGWAGLFVARLLVVRSLVLIGGPTLPFPPLYPAWFEALGITIAIRAARSPRSNAIWTFKDASTR